MYFIHLGAGASKKGQLKILRFENFELEEVVTPIDAKRLEHYLKDSKYDEDESKFLIQGFTTGFPIGYQGPTVRSSSAQNIPFTPGVGDKIEMWNKIMNEVSEGRVAGPYKGDQPPYQNFIQSPIGLVPKSGGKTRLIFHLSHDFFRSRRGKIFELLHASGTLYYQIQRPRLCSESLLKIKRGH